MSETQVSREIKFDHFGYRPADRKIAVFTGDPEGEVEIRNQAGQTVWRVPEDGGRISYRGFDKASEDDVWLVEFTGLNVAGKYHFHSAALGQRSYEFEIRDDIYNVPALAALKAWYFQRCNIPKVAPYAHHWQDEKPCHMQDKVCISATYVDGDEGHGLLDLTGNWHNAGDYPKSVSHPWWLLATYELNPSVFAPDQLNIPESGNGIPDILSEAKWGLDQVLKACLPDGRIIGTVISYPSERFASPPSSDMADVRAYFPPDVGSTASGVSSLALGARVFRGIDDDYANALAEAAVRSWKWLQKEDTPPDDEVSWGDIHFGLHAVPNPPSLSSARKCQAAAEVFAMDQSITSARDVVDNLKPDKWADAGIYPLAPHLFIVHTYCRTPEATPKTVENMKRSMEVLVRDVLERKTEYGFALDERDWTWGSNAHVCRYGLALIFAARLGATGPYSEGELNAQALAQFNYIHGLNPMQMVYLTNMAEYGGEHSSFQTVHGWFSCTSTLERPTRFRIELKTEYGSELYNGKPEDVDEPLYPYYHVDSQVSKYGPCPGLLVGGANKRYTDFANAIPPADRPPAKSYRDFSTWVHVNTPIGLFINRPSSITEPCIGYQGPYTMLGSCFMVPGGRLLPPDNRYVYH